MKRAGMFGSGLMATGLLVSACSGSPVPEYGFANNKNGIEALAELNEAVISQDAPDQTEVDTMTREDMSNYGKQLFMESLGPIMPELRALYEKPERVESTTKGWFSNSPSSRGRVMTHNINPVIVDSAEDGELLFGESCFPDEDSTIYAIGTLSTADVVYEVVYPEADGRLTCPTGTLFILR